MDKKFSDFQDDKCEPRQTITFKKKKNLCPVCTPNPNFFLEKNWFEMDQPWLDEAECRYNIRIRESDVVKYVRQNNDNLRIVSKQDKIRFGIRKLLIHHNKLLANETVCSFGGCKATFEEIKEHRETIRQYQQALGEYESTESTQTMSIAGAGAGSLLAAFGVGGGWAVFGVAALSGIITDSVHAARMTKIREETFSEQEQEDLNVFLKSYFGSDLSYKLEKLQALYPQIHPMALEWHAKLEGQYLSDAGQLYYRVSVPAEEFHKIPDNPLAGLSEETSEKSLYLNDIIIDGVTFVEDFIKLKFALQGYEFYYSAFQQVENLQIFQKEDTGKRINYTNAIRTMSAFKNTLNNILKANGYQRLNSTADFFGPLAFPNKIKFRFNTTDDKPFNLSRDDNDQVEVYVLGDCSDYVLLEQAENLDNPRFHETYGFLSRLSDIINDLTAQNTKPWLEFTLEYFYPVYVADYGLNSGEATEEQKNALLCFLEKELGFGDGALVDSLTKSILSAFDVMRSEFVKNSCKDAKDADKHTWWKKKTEQQKAEEKNKADQEKRKEMVNRLQKQEYKKLLAEEKRKIEESDGWANSPSGLAGGKPSDHDVEVITGVSLGVLQQRANLKANELYDDPVSSSQNKPWLHDSKLAAQETFEKETLLLHHLESTFDPRPSSEDLFEFVSAIGICGTTKLQNKAIECLTNGMSLDDILEIMVDKLLDTIDLRYMAKFFNGLPGGIQDELQSMMREEFGDVNLVDLIRTKSESGSMTVGDIIGKDKKLITKAYDRYLEIPAPMPSDLEKLSFSITKIGGSIIIWHEDIEAIQLESYRDPSSGKISVKSKDDSDFKDQKKKLKKLKKVLRKRLKTDSKSFWEASKDRYDNIKGTIEKGINNVSTFQAERDQMKDNIRDGTWHFGSDQQGEYAFNKVGPDETWQNKQHFISDSYMQPMAQPRTIEDGPWTYLQDIDSSITFTKVPNTSNLEGKSYTADDTIVSAIIEKYGLHPGPLPVPDKTKEDYILENTILEKENSWSEAIVSTSDILISAGELEADPKIISKKLERTTIGVKIDTLLSHMLLSAFELIIEELGIDEVIKNLKSHPVTGFVWDSMAEMNKECPMEPLFHPPLKDFMKSFKVDICDPTISLATPKILVPSFNWRFQLQQGILAALAAALEKILTELLTKLFLKILSMLEGALCKALNIAGSIASDALQGQLGDNSWLNALDQAFCGTADEDKTRDLANNLLGLSGDISSVDPNIRDQAGLVLDAMAKVGTTEQFLQNLINPPRYQNKNFNVAVAEAVTYASPNFAQLLGDPAQVSAFFENVGSYLPQSEKDNIQALLDQGLPPVPVSDSICLSNEQLEKWNEDRIQNLIDNGFSPKDAKDQIDDLNNSSLAALNDLMDLSTGLQSPGGLFADEMDRLANEAGAGGFPEPPSTPANPTTEDPSGADSVLDGPPGGSDVCEDKPLNPFAMPMPPNVSEMISSLADTQYELIEDIIIRETLGRNGVIGQSLADTNGLNIRKHSRRTRMKYWFPDYANTEDEYDEKFADPDPLLSFLSDGSAMAVFPETVSKLLKDRLVNNLDDMNFTNVRTAAGNTIVAEDYNPPGLAKKISWYPPVHDDLPTGNKQMIYEEGLPDEGTYFKFQLNNVFRGKNFKHLDYNIGIWDEYSIKKDETTGLVQVYSRDYEMNFDEKEQQWFEEKNIVLPDETAVLDSTVDYRQYAFSEFFRKRQHNELLNSALFSGDMVQEIYEFTSNHIFKGVVESILTDPDGDNDGDPLGFVFGYQSDVMPEDAFDYEVSLDANETKTLGTFPNSNGRIIPLDPSIYSGIGISYLNPPYTVLPIEHTGWIDIASAVLPGPEGCDPKNPSVLKLDDIRDRTKDLTKDLPIDPRLSKNPDCVDEIPFNIIMENSAKASMEGTVRTITRLYTTEYFLRSMGPLSNLQFNSENYDDHLSVFILDEMKASMMEEGSRFGSRKIRLKRRNYWLTFLEQSVETYQRMIDIDGITPPDHLLEHLDIIQQCRDSYVYPTKKLRQEFFNNRPWKDFTLPGREITTEDLTNPNFMNWAIAYRIYGDRIFTSSDNIDWMKMKWRIRLKKIRFYTKILAIRSVEESAKLILLELIKSELRTMSKKFTKGTNFTPKIHDLKRYFLGMNNIFSNTSLNIGLTSYYREKSVGTATTGDVGDVNPDIVSFQYDHGDEDFLLVLEKYIKFEDKPKSQLPPSDLPPEDHTIIVDMFANRDRNLKGVVPLSNFEVVLGTIEANYANGKNLSDFFGDLSFTYKVDIRKAFLEIFGNNSVTRNIFLLERLIELNKEEESRIRVAFQMYNLNQEHEHFEVFVSEDLCDVSSLEPGGVQGSVGVKYGIRACITPSPDSSLHENLSAKLTELIQAAQAAATEAQETFDLNAFLENHISDKNKAYIFNVGSPSSPEFQFLFPIISQEMEVKDVLLKDFNPISGEGSYDTECMVDLLVSNIEYSILFNKIFPLKVISSMTGLFCCYGHPFSLGQFEGERHEDFKDKLEDADWDRRYYRRSRRFLRKEFQGFYLSRYLESDLDMAEDKDKERKFRLNNPFADITFSKNWLKGLNWFQRRRLVSAPYDAHGQECADPLKDLF